MLLWDRLGETYSNRCNPAEVTVNDLTSDLLSSDIARAGAQGISAIAIVSVAMLLCEYRCL